MKLHFPFKQSFCIALIALLTAVSVVFALGTKVLRSLTAINYSFHYEDKSVISLDDICSTDSKSFTCWHPNGNLDPAEAKELDLQYAASPGPALKLKLNRRSLVVISHYTNKSTPPPNLFIFPTWSDGPPNHFEKLAGGIGDGNIAHQEIIEWYYPSVSQKSADFTLTIPRKIVTQQPLEPIVGSHINFGGGTITITSITQTTEGNFKERYTYGYGKGNVIDEPEPSASQRKVWEIKMRFTDMSQSGLPQDFTFVPYDKDGRAFSYLTKDGNESKVSPNLSDDDMNMQGYIQSHAIIEQPPYPSDYSGQITASMFVDPQLVGEILVSADVKTGVVFPNVALYPKHEVRLEQLHSEY